MATPDFKRKRGGIKAKLSNLTKFIVKIETAEQNQDDLSQLMKELNIRDELSHKLLDEFNETQDNIECASSENDIEAEYDERYAFENTFYSIRTRISRLLELHSDNAPVIENDSLPVQSINSISQLKQIKLPTIQLPKFKGAFTHWIEFKNTYESLIHDNSAISAIQKFHYLRASLEGVALEVIRSIDFTATNYPVAWELLCNRFNNNQLLVFNHIKSIFDISNIIKPTASNLRQLVDDLSKHLRALNSLKLPTDAWDVLIIFVISNKLDKDTVKYWEEFKKETDIPTLNEFKIFLNSRADLLETLENRDVTKPVKPFAPQVNRKYAFASTSRSCNYCSGEHLIYNCADFLKLNTNARCDQVKKLKLCQNCLRTGHFHKFCPGSSCRKCHNKHNTLLHVDKQKTEGGKDVEKPASSASLMAKSKATFSTHVLQAKAQSLLATVRVAIFDWLGNKHYGRAILDCGSQTNFITNSLVEKLGLTRNKTNFSIVGINQVLSTITSKCNVTIQANRRFERTISCYILPVISDNLPTHNFDFDCLNIPQNIQLADPEFNLSTDIDLLLGAPLFWEILREGKIKLGDNNPIMQNTEFGWIVAGPLNLPHPTNNKTYCNFSKGVQAQLQTFWEIEEHGSSIQLSSHNSQCEQYFQKTVARDTNGRFIVSIPFKDDISKLGDSKSMALKRFYSVERRLHSNPQLKAQYVQFMRDYESLEHMSKLQNPVNETDCYYLAHHSVEKSDSLTTKLRVVFDGSAPTNSGWSLNDLQHIGPSLQQELINILIRFRQHSIVITADVLKMYRQILVEPSQRRYQRILWRSDPDDEISTFELNTVTYGLASSPYLAIRCLKQLANEHRNPGSIGAERIARDMYVDDLITGADTVDEAIRICNEVSHILSLGCFDLKKWASNNTTVLKGINAKEQDLLSNLQNFGDDSVKTLGLQWCSKTDTLTYKINSIQSSTITKRSILSEISKIYDPLGLLATCIIVTKIIMRHLWSLQLNWDDSVPDNLKSKWLEFRNELVLFNHLSIPRQVLHTPCEFIQLHGFSDASQNAYAACIYARSMNKDGFINVRLFCAKSKVAPVKTTTIPRLELCGAVLVANLMNKVKTSVTCQVNCYYWTDSQIVLCWIRTNSNILQTFVANRVGEIQRLTDPNSWAHVESKHNPADIASRGLSPSDLLKEHMWWNGPQWLSQTENNWPIKPLDLLSTSDLPEVKNVSQSLLSNPVNTSSLFTRFSNLIKLKHIVALMLRFVNNCRFKSISPEVELRTTGPLTLMELNVAFNKLLIMCQQESFKTDIDFLKGNSMVRPKSKLASLTPFIDSEGLLRVGGRLKNSPLDFNQKHPILLSGDHELSKLILYNEHINLDHCGPQLLLASSRSKFWILRGRNLARKTVHKCIRCFKFNPKTVIPIMGNLPSNRVQPSFPFANTGTDYAGPFFVRDRRGRGVKKYKCYICLFICLATKALHLEVVTDLTTESFLATFKRFTSRRGKPSHIYSDNGTMYVGANNELIELKRFLMDNNHYFITYFANNDMLWHFIPPQAPNFGGIWEAAVKSIKSHLKRILVNCSLTLEQFMTVLAGIEGILNSRPLSSMSDDPNDLLPLTPAHFLIGRPVIAMPEQNLTTVNSNRLKNFQHLQQLQQHFWLRWSTEYLSELQQRGKWRAQPETIVNGTLVLLKEDNLPVYNWKLGRIIDQHPGNDGVTRVVTVKTATGSFKRPVTKVCPLPIDTETISALNVPLSNLCEHNPWPQCIYC